MLGEVTRNSKKRIRSVNSIYICLKFCHSRPKRNVLVCFDFALRIAFCRIFLTLEQVPSLTITFKHGAVSRRASPKS